MGVERGGLKKETSMSLDSIQLQYPAAQFIYSKLSGINHAGGGDKEALRDRRYKAQDWFQAEQTLESVLDLQRNLSASIFVVEFSFLFSLISVSRALVSTEPRER